MRVQLAQQAKAILGKSDLVIITERVDDVALLIGQMVKMGLPEVLDRHIPRHWTQRGISWGWTAVIWLASIVTEGDHRKVSVETSPKELLREVRPFWRRVRSVLARVRSVLEGVAAVGEPLWTGGVGCRGVLGTDLPLSPCDMGYLGAWEALGEDRHDRSGPETRSYPCATRGTSVDPNALACFAIVLALRSRYGAS